MTNMCMIQDEQTGKVLVQHRVHTWNGLAFPGGHVEYGESLYQSTVREIKEETGLDIYQLELCGIKNYYDRDGNLQVVVCYKTTHFTGELIQNEREGKVSWMSLAELNLENTALGFLDMLPVFLNDDIAECYYELETGNCCLY